MTMKRLCLNMLVKNQREALTRCLSAAAPYIACWVIGDAGSTDGTQEFIRSFFAALNIPGELHQLVCDNFSQARQEVFDRARASELKYDYVLLMEADTEFGGQGFAPSDNLTTFAYKVVPRTGATYLNNRMLRRSSIDHWQQDIFVSLLNAAKLKEALSYSTDEILAAYTEAAEVCPTRAEALHGAARVCRNNGLHQRGYEFAVLGLGITPPTDAPALEDWIYDYGLLDELAVNAYWAGKYKECADACDQLLTEGKLPVSQRDRVDGNKNAGAAKLQETRESSSPTASTDEPNASTDASGSNRVDKFERDARLLLEALEKDPENQRYWFYLAQSYRDAGRTAEAAVAYAKRAAMGGWDEEAWNARLQEARCLRQLGDEAGFIQQALAAFNQRPQRAEPLYDLARFYRDKGMNDASVLFSEAGLAIKRPEQDILFLEDHIYTTGLLEEFAIAANYARDPVRKDRGFAACNWLALNRTIGDGPRELARSNLYFYMQSAKAMMPSFSALRVEFTAPDGYIPINPSVARSGERIVLLQRSVNYRLNEAGQYLTPDDEPMRTRNFLLRLSDDLSVQSASEVLAPADMPEPAYDLVRGFEDMRLFAWGGQLWAIACVREMTLEGWCEQVLGRIDDGEPSPRRLTDWRVLHPSGPRLHEKNWMPQVKPAADGGGEQLRFIYQCDPTRIIDERAQTIFEQAPAISAQQFSGGSQAIAFDGGWLAIVHEARTRPGEARRYYQHRFVWFDELNSLAKVSRPFFFNRKGVEFAAGLAWHPDAKRLLISYGVNDSESWIAAVEAAEVRWLLEEVERFASIASGKPPSRIPAAMREHAQKNAEFTNLASISKGTPLMQSDSSWTPPAPAAGTELMIAGLKDRIPDMLGRIQLHVNLFPDNPSDEKPLVMWMHHDVNQNAVQWCRNPALVDRVTCFAFVSHWQRERYQSEFGISPSRCVVLHNATTIAQQRRVWTKADPLRFAYTSTPFRGLSVLLDAWEQLRLNRAELHIWSSMRLYHHDDSKYQPLFARARALEGVIYHGIVPNPELKSALRDIDFLAYPSTFEETSCLAVIEAMAAGCRVIVPALGALPETTCGFAHVYPWSADVVEHATLFASAIAEEVESPWFDAPEMSLTQQNYCELFFDWKERVKEWTRLIENLTDRERNRRSPHNEQEHGLIAPLDRDVPRA